MELERRDVPTIALASSAFVGKATIDAKMLGVPDARVAVFKHPLGGVRKDELVSRVDDLYQSLLQVLTKKSAATMVQDGLIYAQGIRVPADPIAMQTWYWERQLSDGLPILAPTREAVALMVAGSGCKSNESVGAIPPRGGIATVEQIAVNAVMAGCRPEHMPVLIAAVGAMLEPRFNLRSIQATTHPVAPLLVVHGPITREIGMNAGAGVFGPGSLANAVIGRALRLILWNIGGAITGTTDRATLGAPSKYSFCIAENVEATPWGASIVERGLSANASAVTVFGVDPPHNVNDHEHTNPQGILNVVADELRGLGQNTWFISWHGQKEILVVLCPEHAATVASTGWSRQQVRRYLYDATQRKRDELVAGGMYNMRDWPEEWNCRAMSETIPLVPNPDDIHIIVAGGAGKHSAVLPSFGGTMSVTREINNRI